MLVSHTLQGNWPSIVQILDRLTEDYAYSPQANCRKGGLLALAAAAVALAERKQVRERTVAETPVAAHACMRSCLQSWPNAVPRAALL